MHLSLSPPTPGRVRMRIIRDLQESFDKFPTLGTFLRYKSPTFCIGIPKTMKILRQIPQPWGQNMRTNRYKSPPIALPGGRWELTMIGALLT